MERTKVIIFYLHYNFFFFKVQSIYFEHLFYREDFLSNKKMLHWDKDEDEDEQQNTDPDDDSD